MAAFADVPLSPEDEALVAALVTADRATRH
jgi:hypothetical protein